MLSFEVQAKQPRNFNRHVFAQLAAACTQKSQVGQSYVALSRLTGTWDLQRRNVVVKTAEPLGFAVFRCSGTLDEPVSILEKVQSAFLLRQVIEAVQTASETETPQPRRRLFSWAGMAVSDY
jgi:hypothetical protein